MADTGATGTKDRRKGLGHAYRQLQPARVTSSKAAGRGLADIHNLVTLSRYPIRAHEEVRHSFVAPLSYQLKTSIPAEHEARPVGFDRPMLVG
jgi:hypothetical protein